MGTHRVPSISHSVTLDICAGKQQGFLTHRAGAFKAVAAIGHAAEPAVFDTAATTGGFQSGIGHIVVNEVFHLGSPWSVVHDAAPVVHDSVLSRAAEDHSRRDSQVVFRCLCDVVHV